MSQLEGDIQDVFALQDRITENVTAAIEPKLQAAEIERMKQKPASNLDAYDLLLRALMPAEPGIAGLIDHTHTPVAHRFDQLVIAQRPQDPRKRHPPVDAEGVAEVVMRIGQLWLDRHQRPCT